MVFTVKHPLNAFKVPYLRHCRSSESYISLLNDLVSEGRGKSVHSCGPSLESPNNSSHFSN